MTKASNSQVTGSVVAVMINCTVALEGSKRFYAGLDQLPAGFDELDVDAQAKELAKALKIGEQRRVATNKHLDELRAAGKQKVITIVVNGEKVQGKVDWNSAKDGLRARVNIRSKATMTTGKADRKRNAAADFLGLS